MEQQQMTITILISECNDWRGAWLAQLYKSEDLDSADEVILHNLSGYGDTPLEASANLLTLADAYRKRQA